VDRDKMSRVFINLIDNALKFTPAGGQICVRGERLTDDCAWVRCAVLDTGPGVPSASQGAIFRRYARVEGREGRRPGTGLGLAFCQLVIQAHSGQIWAENRSEGGSAFYFTLPISGSPSHDAGMG